MAWPVASMPRTTFFASGQIQWTARIITAVLRYMSANCGKRLILIQGMYLLAGLNNWAKRSATKTRNNNIPGRTSNRSLHSNPSNATPRARNEAANTTAHINKNARQSSGSSSSKVPVVQCKKNWGWSSRMLAINPNNAIIVHFAPIRAQNYCKITCL